MKHLLALILITTCAPLLAAPPVRPTTLPVNECTAASSRDPLVWMGRDGKEGRPIEEGRRILVDADSYPRAAGKLLNGPSVTKTDGGFEVRFALDSADDVAVRVLEPGGRIVRHLGAGVLGPNAPEPFEKDALRQCILWDGLDDRGKPVPPGSRVEVAVGLAPRFERFIGYAPAQLTDFVSGLSVDLKGRVYVTLHTSLRYDPVVLRFGRDGNYLDMVYPSDPAQLVASGRRLQDVYSPVEVLDGRPIPVKEGVWRFWMQRWEDYNRVPFAAGPDGKAYFILGTPTWLDKLHSESAGKDSRIFRIDDLDRFWFQPGGGPTHYAPIHIFRWDAAFAFDRQGHVLVATKAFEGSHGDYTIGDAKAYGTIRKVNLQTGMNVPAFSFNGAERLAEPSVYLGTPGTVVPDAQLDAMDGLLRPGADKPQRDERDSDRCFVDIEDLTVDDAGNIYVVDGSPRRIKCYEPSGRWRGEIASLAVGGTPREFLDVANVFWANRALYILTSFRGEPDGPMHLVKCDGNPAGPRVIWSVTLHPFARFIAVDASGDVPLVWIGNGNGPATFSRIEDRGAGTGEVRHVGGRRDRTIGSPFAIAAADDGSLFVHDYDRSQIIRTNSDGSVWQAIDVPHNQRHRAAAETRRFVHGDPHHRDEDLNPRSMCVDNINKRLLVSTRAGHKEGQLSPGFQCFHFDLTPCDDYQLRAAPGSAGQKAIAAKRAVRWPWDIAEGWGPSLGGFDRAGNLYAAPITWMRTDKIPDELPSFVSRYGPDGTLRDARLCRYYLSSGNIAVDSRGGIYVTDVGRVPPAKGGYDFPDMTWGYWIKTGPKPKGPYYMWRGDHPVTHTSQLSHIVKFGPAGGDRFTEGELWAHRGGSMNAACGGCDFASNLLACDAADRILAGDVAHSCVSVLDTAGNLITRFGTYGNAQTLPGPDGSARDLGFRNIYGLAAAGDIAYVCDKDLRRVAKISMKYRQASSAPMP